MSFNALTKITYVLILYCSNCYQNVQLVIMQAANRLKLWNGDLGETGEKKMTLIYRGQKYVQNKVAAKKQHTELTYRGKAYTS